jgi:hypothetical protein
MNDQTKIEYYDILNGIRMVYLKSHVPFNIINDSKIKLTYNEIKLKYIDNKNYFVTVNKDTYRSNKTPWTREQKKEFFKQRAKDERAKSNNSNINMNEPWTKEKREEFIKKRHDGSHNNQKRVYTPEETAAYNDRMRNREQNHDSRQKTNKQTGGRIMVFY